VLGVGQGRSRSCFSSARFAATTDLMQVVAIGAKRFRGRGGRRSMVLVRVVVFSQTLCCGRVVGGEDDESG